MNKILLVNKSCRGLYGKLAIRLIEIEKNHNFIPWSNIYAKICAGFSIKKQDLREIFLVLYDLGLVENSPKGIKLNFEIRE